MSNKIIEVQNIKVNITNIDDNDYICISDFCKYKEGKSKADDIIRNWLRNRITLGFLGTWESIYNPNFNSVEFDGFRKSAGLHTFTLSVTEWCEKTNAIGIYSKRGKYGGTYAHKDIAFEFASAISPVFKLYLIKEFERVQDIIKHTYYACSSYVRKRGCDNKHTIRKNILEEKVITEISNRQTTKIDKLNRKYIFDLINMIYLNHKKFLLQQLY